MERTGQWAVALGAAAAAGAGTYALLDAGVGLAVANAAAYGTFGWLSVAHWDLLHGGGQPWPVARLAGAIGGFSVFVSLVVLTAGVLSAPVGERAARAALVFGTTWAGVGLGISLARAEATTEREASSERPG